jgi:copper(I)-binding protein
MFEGLHKRIKQGQSFPLTIEFSKAGKVEVMVEVKSLGYRGNAGHAGHGMKPMKGRGKNTTPSHPK